MRDGLDTEPITPESAKEIADKWMDIDDTDGSGTVDFGEFTDFIKKMAPDAEDTELKQVFNAIDEDQSGELDK